MVLVENRAPADDRRMGRKGQKKPPQKAVGWLLGFLAMAGFRSGAVVVKGARDAILNQSLERLAPRVWRWT